jgi:hypothetical protein
MIRQYALSPAVGKRLIAKGIVAHPWVTQALRQGRLVIVAGTTNGYVGEEILRLIGQSVGFAKRSFFRGITLPPAVAARRSTRSADALAGDIVIEHGEWRHNQSVFDVAGSLGPDDLILKGANALDLEAGAAATFVDRADAGAMGVILPAVLGRQARLLVPVGLEKRVSGSLVALCQRLAGPDVIGARMCPLPGPVFTELEAITQLTGARATLVGAGGVGGAEGGVWLAIEDTAENMGQVEALVREIIAEPLFEMETAGTP